MNSPWLIEIKRFQLIDPSLWKERGKDGAIELKVEQNGNTFKGEYTFKMSSYGITPPSVMMGSIKTGDEEVE